MLISRTVFQLWVLTHPILKVHSSSKPSSNLAALCCSPAYLSSLSCCCALLPQSVSNQAILESSAKSQIAKGSLVLTAAAGMAHGCSLITLPVPWLRDQKAPGCHKPHALSKRKTKGSCAQLIFYHVTVFNFSPTTLINACLETCHSPSFSCKILTENLFLED